MMKIKKNIIKKNKDTFLSYEEYTYWKKSHTRH